jgi:hypothetical protein
MTENKCQMCFKTENPDREVKDGDYTLQVCASCKDKYEQEQIYKRVQPLVEALCKELNGGNKEQIVKAFLAAFNREHRYLQGSFFQLLWLFFREYSQQNKAKFFDDRNAHCQGMAKKWYEAM